MLGNMTFSFSGSLLAGGMLAEGPSLLPLRYFSLHETIPPAPLLFAIGAVVIALHLFLLLRPTTALKGLRAFPRNWVVGIVLTAICVPWFALLFRYNVPFLWMQEKQEILSLGALALFFPIIWYMKDLLAVRALGCFLLLFGCPVRDAALWHHPDWARWIVMGWIYLLVIVGIIFVLYPWRFRRWVERFLVPASSRNLVAFLGIATGILLILSGLVLKS